MKKIYLFLALMAGVSAFAQNATFKMPTEIKFDKNVVQKISDKKTATLSYYFTANGDYAALKPDTKEGNIIIYTKEGNMLIVSEKEKSIVVMNMKGFLNVAKDMAEKRAVSKDSSHSKNSFNKTGKTKIVSGYTAEEYEITTEKEKLNVWYAKVDFDSALAMSMGMAKGPGDKGAAPGGAFENIPGMDKSRYMVEMQKDGKTVLETVSITKTDFTFSSAGYTVQDMSSMMKGKYQ